MILRLFRTAWLLIQTGGNWSDGSAWFPEDAEALARFLSTNTGAKLRARLRNAALSMNASAVQGGNPHECGRAFGYILAVTDIQTLSASVAPEDDQKHENGSETGADVLEHLNP